MGQKDMAQRLLADYEDVFADIVNVLLFQGAQVIKETSLVQAKNISIYKATDNALHEQERDVSKIWIEGGIYLSMLGLEHQTKLHPDMPIRVIGYDGASYRSQLLKESKERYPVVTIVLNFNAERWERKHLLECFHVDDRLKPYVNDYTITVFDIAYLTEEQIAMFTSDFRLVAEYFVHKRTKKRYEPSAQVIRHVDEFLKLMGVLTADSRWSNISRRNSRKEKEGTKMCEYLDMITEQGRAEGRTEGRMDILRPVIREWRGEGLTTEDIIQKMMEMFGYTEEEAERFFEAGI